VLGCLFDVHGNLPALEAVLDDARAVGVERFVLGGDYAALGGWPAECVAALAELDAVVRIRGNWERWVADPPPEVLADPDNVRANQDIRAALGDERVAELGGLPHRAPLGSTLVCHASPAGDMRGFATKASGSDAELLDGTDATRLIVGHTHVQFRRTTATGVEVVNPGSVGLPMDGDRRAAWALLRDDGGVELRRVAYDVDAAIDGVRTRYPDAGWTRFAVQRLQSASA
jgi:diadenosine tetraphosphatase ApaH/serine/threonine PP2A family protein phosphatase